MIIILTVNNMASKSNNVSRYFLDPSQFFYNTIEQFAHLTVQSARSSSSSDLLPLVKKTLDAQVKEPEESKVPSKPSLEKHPFTAITISPASTAASKKLGFPWLKIINENTEISLSDPVFAVSKRTLGKIFPIPVDPESNLYKIVAWTIHIQKILDLDPVKAAEIIQTHKLGRKLSQCAEYIGAIPAKMHDGVVGQMAYQIKYTAVELLKSLSHYYFHQTSEWKNGREGLKRSYSDEADKNAQCLQKDVSALPKESGTHAWVIAKDAVQGRLWISRSGRTWVVNLKHLEQWTKSQLNWEQVLGDRTSFCTLMVNSVAIEIVSKITASYAEFCRMNSDHSSVSHFTDFNKVRGLFCQQMFNLVVKKPDAKDRMSILSCMQKHFQEALPEKKWKQLFTIVDKGTFTHQDFLSVVMSDKSTYDQLIAMALATANCGEFKILLELCRELNFLSEESLKLLPKTLGERLEIYAFRAEHTEETGKRKQIKICEKCRQLWTVFEALYWSVRNSGLNLSAIENLDRVLSFI